MNDVTVSIAGWVVTGIVFGTLLGNIFLNVEYRKRCKNLNKKYYDTYYIYKTSSYEEWLLEKKTEAYKDAMRDSKIDRTMSLIMGIIFVPAVVIVVLGYYLVAGINFANNRINLDLRLNASGRDLTKIEKQVKKAKFALEQEIKEVEEWNEMVDILNQNKLNDITNYQKRKVPKKIG